MAPGTGEWGGAGFTFSFSFQGMADDPQMALALHLDPVAMKKADPEGPGLLVSERELSIRIGRAGLLSGKRALSLGVSEPGAWGRGGGLPAPQVTHPPVPGWASPPPLFPAPLPGGLCAPVPGSPAWGCGCVGFYPCTPFPARPPTPFRAEIFIFVLGGGPRSSLMRGAAGRLSS